jgi:hypothetical protein
MANATKNPNVTRFGRTAPATGRGRFARGAATPRRPLPPTALRRRKPQESTLQKAMHAVLPAAAAKKAAPSTKKGKAGGFALAAAAAGMAFKNREKLTRMVRKDDDVAAPSGTATHDAHGNHASTPPV